MFHPSRLRPTEWTILGALGLVVTLFLQPPLLLADAAGDDPWTAASTFRTEEGWYATPVHAALLTDGRILFVGVARESFPATVSTRYRRVAWIFNPPPAGADIPQMTTIEETTEPVQLDNVPYGTGRRISDDLECMGSVHDGNGRVITAGGARAITSTSGQAGNVIFGIPYLTIFTDETNWIRSKTMVGVGPHKTRGRWYPTLTRTPDGRILIIGGIELIDLHEPSATESAANLTIESFDPATGEQRLMSGPERTPVAIHAGDYAHSFVLPFPSAPKDILILGERGVPVLGRSTTTDSYAELPRPRPGPSDPKANFGASSVQLPLRVQNRQWGYGNGSAMVVNGNMHTQYEHQADVFDPMTAGWRTPSIEMGFARHHPSTVLLPDGRVLVVNGHDMNGGLDVQKAQYIDPRNGFTVTTDTASSGVIRGYHSVAVLLPDGRVLVAGGRDQVTADSLEKPNYQIYTPSYPAGLAPRLGGTPASLGYTGLFQLTATGAVPKELVLIGLGSMTHSIDMGQRQIELPIGKIYTNNTGIHRVIAGAPANGHVAPPGYYWLFAVSEAGVPSGAKLIKIG